MSKPKFTAILTFRLFIDGLTRYRWLAIPDRIYISHHLSGFSGILKLRNELLLVRPHCQAAIRITISLSSRTAAVDVSI